MKFKTILAALALSVAAGGAGATVLTFDNLADTMYGGGLPLADGMSYDGLNLTYVESGFQVTLNAPNATPGSANIGTGTYEPQTYNWLDSVGNGGGSFVTLTRVGGGLFNLKGFDYLVDASDVSADGTWVGTIEGGDTWTTALNGITELRLSSAGFGQLDNVDVEAAGPSGSVPLPGTLALMLGGLAAGGLARRWRG